MKIGWQYRQSYCNNKTAHFFNHPVFVGLLIGLLDSWHGFLVFLLLIG